MYKKTVVVAQAGLCPHALTGLDVNRWRHQRSHFDRVLGTTLVPAGIGQRNILYDKSWAFPAQTKPQSDASRYTNSVCTA